MTTDTFWWIMTVPLMAGATAIIATAHREPDFYVKHVEVLVWVVSTVISLGSMLFIGGVYSATRTMVEKFPEFRQAAREIDGAYPAVELIFVIYIVIVLCLTGLHQYAMARHSYLTEKKDTAK